MTRDDPARGKNGATGADGGVERRGEAGARAEEGKEATPRPQLRWVQLRAPRQAAEIGQNGRILASYYHAGYDSWEVLLETYEGEVGTE